MNFFYSGPSKQTNIFIYSHTSHTNTHTQVTHTLTKYTPSHIRINQTIYQIYTYI